MKAKEYINVEFECPICGITHYLHHVEIDKYTRFINRRDTGEYIQDIFPDMSNKDREKFLTGYCDDCQDLIFGRKE